MEKGFRGRGWSFPIRTDRTGDIEFSEGDTDIEESIRIILGTAKGERVMRPEFGCDIHDYVFSTIDTPTLNLMETSVREALVRWEPRIAVRNVEVTPERIDVGELVIGIDYRVRSTNTEANLVYPFYLERG